MGLFVQNVKYGDRRDKAIELVVIHTYHHEQMKITEADTIVM